MSNKPKITKLTSTTDEAILDMGTVMHTAIIKNDGSVPAFIDFDETIDTNTSFEIQPGEIVTLEDLYARRLHHKTSAGSTTLRLIRMIRK